MKKLFSILALSVSLPLFATSLQSQLYHFKSLSADITQSMETSSGQLIKSTGHLWILRPGKFRYEITKPNKQLFVSEGQKLYNYEEDLMQVIVSKLDRNLSQTPLLLLSGKQQDLSKLFTIKTLSAGKYQFKPKGSDSLISSITMTFSDQKPVSMRLANSFGQITSIQFNHVKINPKLNASLFDFVAPKGVDVLSA